MFLFLTRRRKYESETKKSNDEERTGEGNEIETAAGEDEEESRDRQGKTREVGSRHRLVLRRC